MSKPKLFEEIINEHTISDVELNYLPLIHTTKEAALFNILISGNIKYPSKCDCYKEYLVYFFYGKGSYFTNKKMQNLSNDPPVSIVYSFEDLKDFKIKRVLPFDSGGYSLYNIKKYNKDHFTHSNPSIETCKKMLSFIYGNNINYYKNKVIDENFEKHKSVCWPLRELAKVYNTIRTPGEPLPETSKQFFSIEVQYEEMVKFNPTYLLIPYTFIQNDTDMLEIITTEYPDVNIVLYGENETINNEGVPLTGDEFHRLMNIKINELKINQQ